MNPAFASPGSAGCFLGLLVCGHVLADFVFQTRGMVERKRARWGGLLLHLLIVLAAQAALILPYLSPAVFGLMVGLTVVHGVIDAGKNHWERRAPGSLAAFLTDQGLHGASLAATWVAWLFLGGQSWIPRLEAWEPFVTKLAVMTALYAFNGTGGSAIVSGVLRRFDLPKEGEGPPNGSMGRTIGILERLLVVTLVWVGQWGALGLILAAKSIARFKDLEKRAFSEYYLIGTLTSVLVATVTALAARALVG